uniref:ARMET C-terminal domain-containing protein n=1 Tax=Alexandrium monilatum TaxID=311494 RepID=A0A7S4RY32_9DINO|mmetsp:Transcript_63623/g.201100  ORF Transcript_63623/g.201100 Transcript_63623/m.201100 type:complete len:176 (+) Transcript_63623:87-614(+)
MPRVHFAVGEDEATLLTVFVRGLEAEIEVEEGQTVEFAKNRAIDQLWQKLPFCHASTALMSLQVFEADSCRELDERERVADGMRLVLAQEPPSEPSADASSAGAGFAKAFADAASKKLGMSSEAPQAGGRHLTREALQKLSVKELRAVIAEAGASSADCVEKADLVERALACKRP